MNAAFRSWMRSTFRRARMERRLDEELRFHVQSYTDYASGCSRR
jgi:hypothetical protein